MNLREAILDKHSKATTTRIVKWVGKSQQRFDELFKLFISDEDLIRQRAAWPMGYCVTDHPELLQKHFSKFIKNLKKPNLHDSIKRNSVRVLQHIAIPECFHGDVMNICFDYIMSQTEAVAIKAFSLTTLEKLSRHYPEILPELKTIIEDRWDYETMAFRSRAKKILSKIQK